MSQPEARRPGYKKDVAERPSSDLCHSPAHRETMPATPSLPNVSVARHPACARALLPYPTLSRGLGTRQVGNLAPAP